MSEALVSITYFAILLGLGVLVANFFKKRHIPDSVFVIMLGLALGPTILGNPAVVQYFKIDPINIGAMGAVPDFLRMLALILIVFTGMFNVGLKVFKKSSDVSVKLALLGVVINTIILGTAAHFVFGIDWVFALLLGGILSGTADAIIFTFDAVLDKDYRKVMTTLKTEAVFNSPICILIPLVFLDFLYLQPGALIEPMTYFSKFILMMVAGVGAGILLGLGFSKLVKRMAEDYTVLLMISIALITYAASEYVGGSGILAVAVCGLIVGDMGFAEKEKVKRFDDYFSELLRIAVFAFLGAQVTLVLGMSDILPIVLFFAAIVLARPLIVMLLMGGDRKNYTKQELFVFASVAPRGIDAAAMAPIVAAALVAAGQGAAASQILNMVVIVIILTVLWSTLMAKIAASKRFVGNMKTIRKPEDEERKEEMEELEDSTENGSSEKETKPAPQEKKEDSKPPEKAEEAKDSEQKPEAKEETKKWAEEQIKKIEKTEKKKRKRKTVF